MTAVDRSEFVGDQGQWLDYEKCMVCGKGYDGPDGIADRAQTNIDNGRSIRCLYYHRRHRYVVVYPSPNYGTGPVTDTRSDIDLRGLADAFRDGRLKIGWE